MAFEHDFRAPFDNNQVERDLRMLRVKYEVSGRFRSPAGTDFFGRLRGSLRVSTWRKQGYWAVDGLTSIVTGKTLMPKPDP